MLLYLKSNKVAAHVAAVMLNLQQQQQPRLKFAVDNFKSPEASHNSVKRKDATSISNYDEKEKSLAARRTAE